MNIVLAGVLAVVLGFPVCVLAACCVCGVIELVRAVCAWV